MKDEKYFLDKLAAEKASEINEDKPLVVFLDGRGITGNTFLHYLAFNI